MPRNGFLLGGIVGPGGGVDETGREAGRGGHRGGIVVIAGSGGENKGGIGGHPGSIAGLGSGGHRGGIRGGIVGDRNEGGWSIGAYRFYQDY